MYKHFFKRLLDIFISSVVLLLIGWFLILVAIFLHFANKGAGAFFLQERPGKNEKFFKVIKFKTMTDERDAQGNLLPDTERLTKVGKFVRSTSIDELPQLINVFKGDMSLIGPRPLLIQYLPLYNEEQKRRHEVRPGISGWAQCHGRNAISWTEKFKLDVWYVDHCTLWTDIKVVWITIMKVLKREDVNNSEALTMYPFDGINLINGNMKNLVIIGAGGMGKELSWFAQSCIGFNKEFIIKGFIDDNLHALDGFDGYPPLLGTIRDYQPEKDDVFANSIGDVNLKKE